MTNKNTEGGDSSPNNDSNIQEASRQLSQSKSDELKVQLDDGSILALPNMVKTLFQSILTELSEGNMVNIVPIHAELTTQEAANYLNVSRPYFIKLLQDGKLAFHKTGSHRRIKYEDLKLFIAKQEKQRLQSMQELADQAQELDMGY